MARTLIKATSFATLHFAVGFGVTYALTGDMLIATGVALVEPAVNTIVFFFHEWAWQSLGRKAEAVAVGADAARVVAP